MTVYFYDSKNSNVKLKKNLQNGFMLQQTKASKQKPKHSK